MPVETAYEGYITGDSLDEVRTALAKKSEAFACITRWFIHLREDGSYVGRSSRTNYDVDNPKIVKQVERYQNKYDLQEAAANAHS